MEVLVTGADTDLGRVIAAGFREAGHGVVISGARRAELEVAAKELEVDYVVCDNTDPDALAAARSLFPHHLDTIVNVPAPRHDPGDPRTYTLAERRAAWHEALDATVLAPVLTLQTVGDHLRSGGSIVSVAPGTCPTAASVRRSRPRCRTGRPDRPRPTAPAASPSTSWPPGAARKPVTTGCAPRSPLSPTRSPAWPCSWRAPRPGTSPAKRCT